jgi:large subunit ribosomal protein L19
VIANIHETIKQVGEKYLRNDLPRFDVGDTVKMKIKVKEADKIRLHPFEGTIIRINRKGMKGSFTVRKVSFGEGVERVFPIHSPVIESLTVTSKGKTKRAKLYYIRDRQGKSARIERQLTTSQAAAVKETSPASVAA